MALWRVECRLSFFSPDSRETRGFVYLGNPGLWRYSIDLGGQMLRKFGQFAYHPKWSFLTFFWHRGSAEGEHFADPVGMDQIERDCYSYIRGGREKNIDRVWGMLLWCISTSSQAFVSMGRHMHG